MKIVPYSPQYKKDFTEMNKAWISDMFELEKEDITVLNGIEKTLLDGGQIFFAIDEEKTVLACCMITPKGNGEWEIEKFAAKGMYTGKGAGTACFTACIDYAKEHGAKKIIIVSNRKCVHALNIYRKHGFCEVPVDKEKFPFERADIAFEMNV